ncbi:MAG: hypothetical protein LQ348_006237 [Seirophora lacunosa]|nr:MAG: hypothetical protein LQ348_006237 [Seirophora lacunosa]
MRFLADDNTSREHTRDEQPVVQTSMIPTFNYRASSPEQTYTLLMIDLSIPASRVDPSQLAPAQLPIAAGLGANRTTRLHFWQAGLTFSANGTLVNTTEPVAYYNGPMPPAGDIAHDYVFYLFQQEAAFAPPPPDSPFNVNNVNAAGINRNSFSVQRFAEGEGVGDLVAANYIQVQNPAAGSNGTAGPTATSSTPSATGGIATLSPSPFTGSAEKLEVRGVLGSIVLGSTCINNVRPQRRVTAAATVPNDFEGPKIDSEDILSAIILFSHLIRVSASGKCALHLNQGGSEASKGLSTVVPCWYS